MKSVFPEAGDGSNMSPRSFPVVIAVALLLAGVAPAAGLVGGAASPTVQSGGAQADPAAVAPHNSSLAPGEVEMRLELDADGDAHWRVMTVVAVRDGDERDAFEDLVDQFNQSDSPLGLETFEATAGNVSRATGRTMNIENVERHHALHNETGALWITFTWTNFGQTVGDRISVDDAFNTTDGVWLPSLSDEETLVVVPPTGYGVSSAPTGSNAAPTSLSDGVARWDGPRDFEQRGPWIVYSGDTGTLPPVITTTSGVGPTTGTATDGRPITGTTSPGDGTQGGFPAALPFVVVAAAVGALVLLAYTRRDDGGDGLGAIIGGGANGGNGGPSAESTAEAETADDSAQVSTEPADDSGGEAAEPASSASTAAGETAGATAGAAAESDEDSAEADDEAPDDGIDEELLSDEERVERLIEQNGGRMKQAAIVQETGWSNAKVSQLLSAMDEDGRIDKLRIGRENLISFPDEDVADLDSE